jgi:hypothetical protein
MTVDPIVRSAVAFPRLAASSDRSLSLIRSEPGGLAGRVWGRPTAVQLRWPETEAASEKQAYAAPDGRDPLERHGPARMNLRFT